MVRASTIVSGLIVLLLAFGLMPSFASADIPTEQKQRTLALADSLYAAGTADSSQTILAAALPAARAGTDSLYLQDLVVRQGCQLAAFGHAARSEPILLEALALAEARGDSATTCRVLRWLGYSVGNQGRFEEAEVITRRQVELAGELDFTLMKGWAQVALGWYAEQRGQIADAVGEYTLAVDIFRSVPDSTGLAWSLNNLGNTRLDFGNRQGARAAYLEAAAIARRTDYVLVEAMAVNNLGVMEFDGGDPGIALVQFRRANELQSRLEYKIERITSGLNIGLCLVYLGRLEEAAAQLEGIVVEAEELDQPEMVTQALLALSSLRYREGRTTSAKKILRRVIYEEREVSPNQRTEGMRSLAAILADQDSLEAGLVLLEKASGQLSGQPNSVQALRVDNLWGEFLVREGRNREGLDRLLGVEERAERIGLFGQRVPALTHAARACRGLERPDSSLVFLERASEVWEAERSLPADPRWREQRGSLGSRIYTDWAAQILDQEHPGMDSWPAVFSRLQRFKGRTLMERMSGPGEVSIGEEEFVSLARLQETLAEDELFLDAYLGPESSFLFAVTRREVRPVVLPAAPELEDRIGLFYDVNRIPETGAVSAADHEALRVMGRALGDVLLAELCDLIQDSSRVIVAPDGILNMLPWNGLSVSCGSEDPPVVPLADRRVSVVPSATIFTTLRTRDGRSKRGPPLRIGVLCEEPDSKGTDLPGARREAAWLEENFAGVTCLAPVVPEMTTPLEEWLDFEVLHFAAHVRSRDAAPWQSEIRLGKGKDGGIRAGAIAAADLPASLVVLAGCESAGGTILSGEGVQGLTSAFLGAGASVVLATLWPVEDAATFDLMRGFYRELEDGQPVGEALAVAQKALQGDPRTAHPFYWGGFVLVGDTEMIIPLESQGGFARWIAIPAIFALLIVILSIRRRLS